MKTYSLRRSALVAFLPPLLLVVVVVLVSAFLSAEREINRAGDASMEHLAEMLNILTRHEAIEGEDVTMTLGSRAEQSRVLSSEKLAFRIWGGGNIVVTSPDASATAFGKAPAPEGFTTRHVLDHTWRILTRRDTANDIIIEVAQDVSERSSMADGVALSLLWPLLIMMPVIMVVVLLGLNRVLAPVKQISREINARGASNLAPLTPQRVPVEILPLLQALNNLFGRVDAGIAREREFTDNAAHELRTPLAALKTRAQVLSRELSPQSRGRQSLDELLTIVDRTTSMVEQLLTLARRRTLEGTICDLSAIAACVVKEFSATPDAADHTLHLQLQDKAEVRAEDQAVRILLANLIRNALQHTGAGSEITVETGTNDSATWVAVLDTGPGIPEKDRERVLRRFARLETRTPGSGLGLALVDEICRDIGAELVLKDNAPQGLRAELRFPIQN